MRRRVVAAGRWCLKGAGLRWLGLAVSALPPAAVPRLGAALSRLRPLLRRRVRIAARNLALCFPELGAAARARLLQATLASNLTGTLDALRTWFAPTRRLRGLADIDGLEHLDAALRAGRGAVVVCAHYDSVELAIRLLAQASRPVAIMLRRYNDPCLEAAIEAGRRRYALATFDKKDVAGFCQAVRDGAVAIYAPDQNANRRTAFVPFFGVPAATLDAIGGVLRRTGGAVVLMWSRRRDDGRFAIDLRPAPADFLDGDGAMVAARYMAWIEARVRQAPEQYLWIHRRFRTRPPGAPDLYG